LAIPVIANLISDFIFPPNKRLTETEAFVTLLFDLSQLSFLLFLTGGLTNPFSLLILAPVTVSASALDLRPTVILGGFAAAFITIIGSVNVPLRFVDGSEFAVPVLFEFGFWLAILIGIAFLGLYARRIATEMHSMSDALLATQMALAREQKLTDLGGVVAAAAHELGTPLATIKLVSTEMIEELSAVPGLIDDARLIAQQVDRCREILRSMGKLGKDDSHLRSAPLSAVLREAAEPHTTRGIEVAFSIEPVGDVAKEPNISRGPEVIHGLRNLVQNAVGFARHRVWIEATYSADRIVLRIIDDGEGFPLQVIGRIGDPFLRSRQGQDQQDRPGYEGMGLGLFIAKTLLERTGAVLSFANASDPFLAREERPEKGGAVVEVIWPRKAIEIAPFGVLGENPANVH
jgi:two-component system, sensor histidine kinase RegB